jgi:hypothetical protein
VAETALSAQQVVAGLRQSVCNEIVLMVRQEIQHAQHAMLEEMDRRQLMSQLVRLRTEVESAVTTLATHAAHIAHRQRVLEEKVAVQFPMLLSQMPAMQATPPTPAPEATPARLIVETRTSRDRSRSRGADPPDARTPMTSTLRAPMPMVNPPAATKTSSARWQMRW